MSKNNQFPPNERRRAIVQPSNNLLAVESVLRNTRVSFRAGMSVSACFAQTRLRVTVEFQLQKKLRGCGGDEIKIKSTT